MKIIENIDEWKKFLPDKKPCPKVLIAAPIGGYKQYSINDWFEWIATQGYWNYDICVSPNGAAYQELAEKLEQVEINDVHGQTKKIIALPLKDSDELSTIQKITYSREKIRRYFADHTEYDYLLFLDTDTIPYSKIGTIQRMIDWKVDIVSGLYFYKESRVPVVIDLETRTNIAMSVCEAAVKENKLIEVYGFGFGIVLFSRKVCEECVYDYDLFGEDRTDDFGYCHVAEQKGYRRYFDPFIICAHLKDPDTPRRANDNPFFPILTAEQEQKINKKKSLKAIGLKEDDNNKVSSEGIPESVYRNNEGSSNT
jgi:hypothetical protein